MFWAFELQLSWKLINFRFCNFHIFSWARKLIIAFEKKAGIIIFTFFRAGWKLTKKKVLLRTVHFLATQILRVP